jgi:hypothetical protein
MEDSLDLNYMPDNTSEVFQLLKQQAFISNFVMVGETALAIQIKHRLSEDLDFIFDGEELNINQIKRNINKLFPNHRIIRQDHKLQMDILVNEVKVTFFGSGAIAIPFKVRAHSFVEGRMHIALVKTIADLINVTKQLIPNLSPVTYTETLVYTKDIEESDMASHLSPVELITKEQIAAFFTQELRKIKELL